VNSRPLPQKKRGVSLVKGDQEASTDPANIETPGSDFQSDSPTFGLAKCALKNSALYNFW